MPAENMEVHIVPTEALPIMPSANLWPLQYIYNKN